MLMQAEPSDRNGVAASSPVRIPPIRKTGYFFIFCNPVPKPS